MPKHLFQVSDFSQNFIEALFQRAEDIEMGRYSPPKEFKQRAMGMIFFESSSRTRWSFHKAALDMGLKVMSTVIDQSTSLSKGESLQDSLELFLNLNFDVVVMRSKKDVSLAEKIEKDKEKFSFINAGFGSDSHPTQALLDAYTWKKNQKGPQIQEVKLLVLGDLKHSRVLRSHLRLARVLGYKVGLCPLESMNLSAEELKDLKPEAFFESRAEALNWCDIVMPLRAQKERFEFSAAENYKADPLKAEELNKEQWLMHPGPVIWGEDIDFELMHYSKSLISLQQKSGLACRAALISLMLEEA